jgi:hypothetical protein
MSDDDTRPIDPEAPAPPPPATEASQQPPPYGATYAAGQPPYAMPVPAGYPAYAAQQRPRFADQVMGMRAVVAVAIACLLIGGLSGAILGRASADNHEGFVRGPGDFTYFQRGPFVNPPNGFPNQPNGNSKQGFGQGQNGG